MKNKTFFLFIAVLFLSGNLKAQAEIQVQAVQVEDISKKLNVIADSLNALNEKLQFFSETFSSKQGLRLTDKQQTILVAFEVLNRAEQRLATLQKFKIELSEKQSEVRLKIAEVEESLRPESVDRGVAFRGTTDAEALREIRRNVLNKEKGELNTLLFEIQNSLRETDAELLNTEMFLRNIRQRIFPAVEKELSDL